jgi:DNA-binding MarR family transcriptional regulator
MTDMRDACTCFRLRHASRIVTRAFDEALRPVGLRSGQFSILAALSAVDEPSISDLAEGLGMDRTTLSRNLQPLEREGLIALTPETAARARTVRLTAAGRSRFAAALPLWQAVQAKAEAALGDTDWARLRRDLDRLEAVF